MPDDTEKDMVPIVFLTAKGSEEDILWGYGLGCDDYIVKPFSLATLYAKILAILRRTNRRIKGDDYLWRNPDGQAELSGICE